MVKQQDLPPQESSHNYNLPLTTAMIGLAGSAMFLTGCGANAQGDPTADGSVKTTASATPGEASATSSAGGSEAAAAQEPSSAATSEAYSSPAGVTSGPSAEATPSSSAAEPELNVETKVVEVYEYGEVDPSSPFAEELRTRYNPESSLEDFLDSFVIRNKENLTVEQLSEQITANLKDMNRAGFRNGLRWVGPNAPEDAIAALRRSIASTFYTQNSPEAIEEYVMNIDVRSGYTLDFYTALDPTSPYQTFMENITTSSLEDSTLLARGTTGSVTIESHSTDNALTARNSLLDEWPELTAESFRNKDTRTLDVIQFTCGDDDVIAIYGLSSSILESQD